MKKLISLVNIETGNVAKYAVTVEQREALGKPVWEIRLIEQGKMPYRHCWVCNNNVQTESSVNEAVGKIMFLLAKECPEDGYTIQITKDYL